MLSNPLPFTHGLVLSAEMRMRWDEAVAGETAALGVAALVPVMIDGAVIDFRCIGVTPRAAALLGAFSSDVRGLTLTEFAGSSQCAATLIRTYVQVWESRSEVVFLAEETSGNCTGRVLHHVVRTRNGLSVMLSCPGEVLRAAATELPSRSPPQRQRSAPAETPRAGPHLITLPTPLLTSTQSVR